MTDIIVRFGCDGCLKQFLKEDLNPAQIVVWRRIDGEPVLTRGDRLFCDECLEERIPHE